MVLSFLQKDRLPASPCVISSPKFTLSSLKVAPTSLAQ